MIGIVDYGLGNVKAFSNVYRNLGFDSKIMSNPLELHHAKKIILPGVGAFDWAMEKLEINGFIEVLNKQVLINKIPILGICVGMQIMAKSSSEGVKKGLGWLDGVVELINDCERLPHMGWNSLTAKNSKLFLNIENPRFYFLHSYYLESVEKDLVIANSQYGQEITSAIEKENIFGVQFHPEKSHRDGIQLLKNFAIL